MGVLLSVNIAVPRSSSVTPSGMTGIDKCPVAGPVLVRDPGPADASDAATDPGATGGAGTDPTLGSGLVGDRIFNSRHHGGEHKAVYAYAREDLDAWAAELGRELPDGAFGENLTTSGLDVNGALIGERWQVGGQVILEVSMARIPCRTFAEVMGQEGWMRRFTDRAEPGAYLRVVVPGQIRAGDTVTVLSRPDHDVSVRTVFQALTTRPELLPRLVDVAALPPQVRDRAVHRLGTTGKV